MYYIYIKTFVFKLKKMNFLAPVVRYGSYASPPIMFTFRHHRKKERALDFGMRIGYANITLNFYYCFHKHQLVEPAEPTTCSGYAYLFRNEIWLFKEKTTFWKVESIFFRRWEGRAGGAGRAG